MFDHLSEKEDRQERREEAANITAWLYRYVLQCTSITGLS